MLNLDYQPINESNYQTSADCLAYMFYYFEPVTQSLGMEYERYRRMLTRFCRVIGTKGLSFTAIDTDTNKSVGVITNIDLLIDFSVEFAAETESFDDVLAKLAPDMAMTHSLIEDYIERMNFKKGQCINLFQCGVLPEFARHGIASHLVDLSIENARQLGYEYAIVTCTSERSKSIFDKLNYKVENEIPYKDFIYKGNKVFSHINGNYTLLAKRIAD